MRNDDAMRIGARRRRGGGGDGGGGGINLKCEMVTIECEERGVGPTESDRESENFSAGGLPGPRSLLRPVMALNALLFRTFFPSNGASKNFMYSLGYVVHRIKISHRTNAPLIQHIFFFSFCQ